MNGITDRDLDKVAKKLTDGHPLAEFVPLMNKHHINRISVLRTDSPLRSAHTDLWNSIRRIRRVIPPCVFNGERCSATAGLLKNCCGGCTSFFGYHQHHALPEEHLERYLQFNTKGRKGFYTSKGCSLPVFARSPTCAFYACNATLSKVPTAVQKLYDTVLYNIKSWDIKCVEAYRGSSAEHFYTTPTERKLYLSYI